MVVFTHKTNSVISPQCSPSSCLLPFGLALLSCCAVEKGPVIIITALCSASALTPSEHEGTLAHAVVVVHVLGAEVCSVDYQTALSACSPTVALQEQPGRAEEEKKWGGGGKTQKQDKGRERQEERTAV